MWYLFALLSACASALRRTSEKQLSHKLNYVTIGWVMQLCSLPVITFAQLLFGRWFSPSQLGVGFWLPTLLASAVLYPLYMYFYINAIRQGELSKVLPLQSLTPIFILIVGRIFISQTPTPLAVLSILIVALGIYVLNLKGRYLHSPLKIFSGDKANALMLAGGIIIAIAGTCDKLAMQRSDSIYYSLVSTILSFVTLFVISCVQKVNDIATIKKLVKLLAISGTLSGVSFLFYALALRTGPLAYISTLKSTSILMGSLLGVLYFKEKLTKPKVIALLLIALGSVLLGLVA